MFVWVIKMLQYERIDVSEGIDVNKARASKECMLFHYRYFKKIGYKFCVRRSRCFINGF